MSRRPMAAYTIETGDDPEYEIYTDAYGLEMNIDNELGVDTVLFAPAESVCKITEETSVTTMGTVYAGVSDAVDSKALKKLNGVTWVLVDGSSSGTAIKQISSIASAKASLLIHCSDRSTLEKILESTKLNGSKLAVALPKINGEAVSEIRFLLTTHVDNADDARVLLEAELPAVKIASKLKKMGADGVFVQNGTFDAMLDVLNELG